MPRAKARHILVSSREQCERILSQAIGGAAFDELAKSYSECPTARYGGDLGHFGPGQMEPEIDQVVFGENAGQLLGPIQTRHGFHLVQISERTP